MTTLEQAVHAMTGLPARLYGVEDRGLLVPGAVADVLVVDLDRLRDTATYDNPHGLAEGVEYSFVNGTLAIDDGRFTDALAGQALVKGPLTRRWRNPEPPNPRCRDPKRVT